MLLDKIINTVFSFGAAIVIFGAWAKLEHKLYSDDVLTAGMLTETGIFCIYGLLEWRKNLQPPREEQPPSAETPRMGELTDTMKHTNDILRTIFKTR